MQLQTPPKRPTDLESAEHTSGFQSSAHAGAKKEPRGNMRGSELLVETAAQARVSLRLPASLIACLVPTTFWNESMSLMNESLKLSEAGAVLPVMLL